MTLGIRDGYKEKPKKPFQIMVGEGEQNLEGMFVYFFYCQGLNIDGEKIADTDGIMGIPYPISGTHEFLMAREYFITHLKKVNSGIADVRVMSLSLISHPDVTGWPAGWAAGLK